MSFFGGGGSEESGKDEFVLDSYEPANPLEGFDSSPSASLPSFLMDDDAGQEDGPMLKFGNLDYIAPGTVAPALGVYGKGDDLDYLFAEDFQDYRKKPWGEQMVYWAGASWVLGGAFGSLQGLVEVMKNSRGKAMSLKLRLNSILNAFGKRGLLVANTAGVLALMLSAFESTSYHFITNDDSPVNYAIAGVATGLLFKSTKLRTPAGLKAAAMWGTGLAALGTGVIYPSRQGYFGKEWQGAV